MQKLYGKLKMNWITVLVFALITGIYTGIMMCIPILENTSFQDIGPFYEWWVIFAVIIVVNCKKNWEAALKCFVFFLLSQPLVYLTEVVFGHLTMDMAIYYYFNFWLKPTFLTLPGGFIAYYCKKQNVLGSIILGLGNTIQACMGVYYLANTIRSFPHHILSAIVAFGSIFIMSIYIQKERKNQIIAIALPCVLVLVILVLCMLTGRTLF